MINVRPTIPTSTAPASSLMNDGVFFLWVYRLPRGALRLCKYAFWIDSGLFKNLFSFILYVCVRCPLMGLTLLYMVVVYCQGDKIMGC